MYDLIEDVEVYLPDTIRFDDDMESLAKLLLEVREGLSSTPSGAVMQDAVGMHRRLQRNLQNEEKVDILSEIAEHPRLFKGAQYADLKSKIDLAADRWRFRPITKLSM